MPFATVLFVIGLAKIVFDLFDKSFRIGTNTLLVMVAAGMIFIVALLADLMVQVTRPKHSVLPAAVVEISDGDADVRDRSPNLDA